MLDARLRRGSRAPVVPTDEHDVGMPFRHPSRNRAHTNFRHQFDADTRMVVGIFQVVDQLRQVLNRVNVMMGRRRDQTHPRR